MSYDGTIGEIRAFAGFVPRHWALCDGTVLKITQNTALFSLIGNAYGGDGKTTFALPNLGGSVAIGTGPAANGPATALGEKVGLEKVVLTSTEMPPHSHALMRKGSTAADQKTEYVGTNSNLAQISHTYGAGQHELVPHLLPGVTPDTMLHPASVSSAPGDQPHENRQPYMALNYAICLSGIFPQRS